MLVSVFPVFLFFYWFSYVLNRVSTIFLIFWKECQNFRFASVSLSSSLIRCIFVWNIELFPVIRLSAKKNMWCHKRYTCHTGQNGFSCDKALNILHAPFLYPLKTSENCKFFLCFQGVEKRCIGNKRVKEKIAIE